MSRLELSLDSLDEIKKTLSSSLVKFNDQLKSDVRAELQQFLLNLSAMSCLKSPTSPTSPRGSHGDIQWEFTTSESMRLRTDSSVSFDKGNVEHKRLPLLHHVESLMPECSQELELWPQSDTAHVGVMEKHILRGHRVTKVVSRHPSCKADNNTQPLQASRHGEEFLAETDEGADLLSGSHHNTNASPVWQTCRSIVLGASSEQFMAFLVALNAVSIGWETDYQAKHIKDDLPDICKTLDAFFCTAFTFEMVVKLYFLGCVSYLCGQHASWHWFDLTLVVLQLFHYLLIAPLPFFHHGHQSMNITVFRLLRLLRLARVLRIIRIVRIFKLIDDLHTLVSSIAASMKSLCWALLLLFIVIYVVAICFTHLVSESRKAQMSIADESDGGALITWYGSLWRTILTMFESIAGGVHWGEVVDPLIEEVSLYAAMSFVAYIAFSFFALLNVVTGVFVSKAMECASMREDDKLTSFLHEIFRRANGGKHEMAWDDFAAHLDTPEMQEYFKIIDVDISQAQGVFELIDADGSGRLDLLEFVSGCLRLRGPARAVELSLLMSETRKKWQWLQKHISIIEHRVTWMGNHMKRRGLMRASSSPQDDDTILL